MFRLLLAVGLLCDVRCMEAETFFKYHNYAREDASKNTSEKCQVQLEAFLNATINLEAWALKSKYRYSKYCFVIKLYSIPGVPRVTNNIWATYTIKSTPILYFFRNDQLLRIYWPSKMCSKMKLIFLQRITYQIVAKFEALV